MKSINPVNHFSGARFAQVLKSGFLSNEFRLSLMSITVMYLLFLFVEIVNEEPALIVLTRLDGMLNITILLSISLAPSFFAASLSNKGNRINHLMLPATNAEKFLARLLVVICGTFVASCIIYFVLFGIIALICLVTDTLLADARINPFAAFSINIYGLEGMKEILIIAELFLIGLLTFSAYLLGGILWKKKSWILTSIIAIPCFFITVVISDYDFSKIAINFSCDPKNTYLDIYIMLFITAVLTTLLLWLSWHLFKRMQVVRPTIKGYLKGLIKRF